MPIDVPAKLWRELAKLAPTEDDPLVLRGCAGCGGQFVLPYPQPDESFGAQQSWYCAKCALRRSS